MRRRLFFLERVLYGDGTLPFNGVFALKLVGRPAQACAGVRWHEHAEEALGAALLKMQARHPLLRSYVEVDTKGMPWFVAGNEWPAIPVRRVVRMGEGHWMSEALAELATAFDTEKGPLFRVAWVADGEAVDLIICFHHCLCDGGSALILLRELLGLIDNPEMELGGPESFIDIETLLPESSKRGKGKRLSMLLRLGLSLGSRLISSRGKRLNSRGEDYLLHWQLSPDLSKSVIGYCRSQGVTVNTLIAVAIVRAFSEVRGEKAFGKVTCPVDIRNYHPGIGKDRLFAFGLAVTLSLKKKLGFDFTDLVTEGQRILSKELKKLDAKGSLGTFEQLHGSVSDMVKVLTYGKPGNDSMFSNMGRVDLPSGYGSFEVEQVYSPVVVGPFANPTTVTTLSWKGVLDFSLVSNRAVLPEVEARRIRDRAMGLIAELVGAGSPVVAVGP